jgi:hypothetical protein
MFNPFPHTTDLGATFELPGKVLSPVVVIPLEVDSANCVPVVVCCDVDVSVDVGIFVKGAGEVAAAGVENESVEESSEKEESAAAESVAERETMVVVVMCSERVSVAL